MLISAPTSSDAYRNRYKVQMSSEWFPSQPSTCLRTGTRWLRRSEELVRPPPSRRSLQTFVCRGIQGLTSVPACLSRIPDSGIVDLLLPLVSQDVQYTLEYARENMLGFSSHCAS